METTALLPMQLIKNEVASYCNNLCYLESTLDPLFDFYKSAEKALCKKQCKLAFLSADIEKTVKISLKEYKQLPRARSASAQEYIDSSIQALASIKRESAFLFQRYRVFTTLKQRVLSNKRKRLE